MSSWKLRVEQMLNAFVITTTIIFHYVDRVTGRAALLACRVIRYQGQMKGVSRRSSRSPGIVCGSRPEGTGWTRRMCGICRGIWAVTGSLRQVRVGTSSFKFTSLSTAHLCNNQH